MGDIGDNTSKHDYNEITQRLRDEAKKLMSDQDIRQIIGWTQGSYGFLLTEEDGNSWHFPNFEPDLGSYPPVYHLMTMNPESGNHGYLAGRTSLYKTIDSAENWESTGKLPGIMWVEYHSYNPLILFAAVSDDYGVGGFYRSEDDGESWHKVTELSDISDIFPTFRVFSPQNTNLIYGHGYSFTNNEYIVSKSSDLAETWELKTNGLLISDETNKLMNVYSLALSYSDSNVLYCGQKGGFSKTIDGGENWFQVDSSLEIYDNFRVSSILLDLDDPNRIYIGTLSSGTPFEANFDNGGLYLSEDDCQSWTKVFDGEVTLIKADKSEPRNIYINTQYGLLTFEDTITKLNNFSVQNFTIKFSLDKNYPNPFNPITNIKYYLPMEVDVELSIYNLLGQRIETLVSKKQEAGSHQIEWNASGISSGVYYYQIIAGQFKDVKKMIVIK